MSDPRILKNPAMIKAKVKFEDVDGVVTLCRFVDREIAKKTPKELIEAKIKEDIGKTSLKPSTDIYSIHTQFSYVEKDAMKDFDFGNVLVQANLPYCLNIPDYYEIDVSIPELDLKAKITTKKIWTNRAISDEEKSDNIDFFAEDRPLYFKKSTILSPQLPFKPEEGWDSYITGRNIEISNDQNGVFRYSRLHIQLNIDLPDNIEKLADKPRQKLLSEIQKKALTVVNRLIENYRDITEEIHIRKLATLKTNLIYFLDQNTGCYVLSLNARAAMMNKSHNEIKKIGASTSSGKKPLLYKMLLLNARSSVKSKDFTLAIVESFQALEIFLENYLISAFEKRGDKKENYTKLLEKYWQTKERLNKVLKNLKGLSLNSETDLWNKWCLRYDQTRNEVFHAGKEPSEEETKETLEVNEQVINWLSSL